ncbi:MAG: DUF2235 domain-containing protein [Burkholderiaceae bacterium]|nr:DUF2235 domain-containing protein [Burkholderiaceae bacterium]
MSDAPDQACLSATARHPDTPPSAEERLARTLAALQRIEPPRPLGCSGSIYVGMFFDGTGNNMKLDYDDVKDEPAKQKHSNVVRLYHVYPDSGMDGANGYFKYYAAGVGTPFDEVGDMGDWQGAAFAAGGEARIIWGLTRVFNAVSRYLDQTDLIDNREALRLSRLVREGGAGRHLPRSSAWFSALAQTWQPRLAQKIERLKSRPRIDAIVVDVFGFSRGAAQARAWVRDLYALCDDAGGQHRLAGRPLRVRFMGLFDTVASVGASGLLAGSRLFDFEGHMAWAERGLQIPPQVGHCLHFVAMHEVRACFPSDSVRVDHDYPPNCREVVYPGAHSDVGGGYRPDAQGKSDQLARIAGHAMYEAAREQGVPLLSERQLKERRPITWKALIPSVAAIRAFTAYQQAAGIGPQPLQAAHRAHMDLYLRYRMRAGTWYGDEAFMQRLRQRGAAAQAEIGHLLKTQNDLLRTARAVALAAYLDRRHGHRTLTIDLAAEALQRWEHSRWSFAPGAAPAEPSLRQALAGWRAQLAQQRAAELLTEPPDLDLLPVADALCGGFVPDAVRQFFDLYVHDSLAGFAGDGIDEHTYNQRGWFKHRRQYFGDAGDTHERRRVRDENARRTAALQPARPQALGDVAIVPNGGQR